MSAGKWNARLHPKQEFVLQETEPVFHYWQYTLLIQCLQLAFDSITSTVNIMRYLQSCEVAQAVQLLQDGLSMRLITRRFWVSTSVISHSWRRFRETVKYARRAGLEQRRATTNQQVSALRFRRSTAGSLQNDLQRGTGVQISEQTVRNRQHSNESRSQCTFVGLILTPCNCAAWKAFAREHQNWQIRHWHPVFSQKNVS